MKASYKLLKAALALRVRKLGPFSLISKLDEFPLFDNFFSDLANFWNLDNFSSFKFSDLDNFFDSPDFLAYFILF